MIRTRIRNRIALVLANKTNKANKDCASFIKLRVIRQKEDHQSI